MKRTDAGFVKRMTGALASLMVVAAFVPSVASAGGPVARLTMYEVLEALQFKKPIHGTDPKQFAWRFAEAALLGNQVVPLSANPVFLASNYSGAEATSNVNINPTSRHFGTGPIRGEFDLLSYQDLDGNGNPNLSDLVVVASGRLRGTLDLRPLLIPDPVTKMPSPYAPVSGRWDLKPGNIAKTFQGAFLIPFQIPGVPGEWYLNPPSLEISALPSICASGVITDFGFGAVCQLAPSEHVLGFPLTKLVIYLND